MPQAEPTYDNPCVSNITGRYLKYDVWGGVRFIPTSKNVLKGLKLESVKIFSTNMHAGISTGICEMFQFLNLNRMVLKNIRAHFSHSVF